MHEALKLVRDNPHPTVDNLPNTKTLAIKQGEWLGESRVAKTAHGEYDILADRQPQVEIFDPGSGELKTSLVGVQRALQLKFKGKKEPFVHN